MANMLLEKYSKRIQLAESVYAKRHNGESMDSIRKITVAKCLDNVNKFLNEAFDSSMGTQRSAMGDYKKFCIALTTVGLPNLIAFDLVAVSPMSSMYGNVAYIEYVKGTTKGESSVGDMVNSVWELGTPDPNYTGSMVVESAIGDGSTTEFDILFDQNSALTKVTVDGTEVEIEVVESGTSVTAGKVAIVAKDGKNIVKFGTAPTNEKAIKIAYVYDNVVIPQEKLPTLKAELKNIGLEAKARRIAVFYSQMAAFQAKTDYGFDLADGLAEQAVGQLSYEIDTEICNMLIDAADEYATTHPTGIADFSKTLPVGVNMADHYASFAAKVEELKQVLYMRTKKFVPNFMLAAADIMPVLNFVPGFQAASVSDINGPYFAGTFNGIKVYVTPNIESGKFVLGVNQGAMQASAGVYAPYMPVVPTQLLGFADGGMSQGWSTMYDAKILNAALLVPSAIVA